MIRRLTAAFTLAMTAALLSPHIGQAQEQGRLVVEAQGFDVYERSSGDDWVHVRAVIRNDSPFYVGNIAADIKLLMGGVVLNHAGPKRPMKWQLAPHERTALMYTVRDPVGRLTDHIRVEPTGFRIDRDDYVYIEPPSILYARSGSGSSARQVWGEMANDTGYELSSYTVDDDPRELRLWVVQYRGSSILDIKSASLAPGTAIVPRGERIGFTYYRSALQTSEELFFRATAVNPSREAVGPALGTFRWEVVGSGSTAAVSVYQAFRNATAADIRRPTITFFFRDREGQVISLHECYTSELGPGQGTTCIFTQTFSYGGHSLDEVAELTRYASSLTVRDAPPTPTRTATASPEPSPTPSPTDTRLPTLSPTASSTPLPPPTPSGTLTLRPTETPPVRPTATTARRVFLPSVATFAHL